MTKEENIPSGEFVWDYTALTNAEPHKKSTGKISANTMVEVVDYLHRQGLFPVVISLPRRVRSQAQARAGLLAEVQNIKKQLSIGKGRIIEFPVSF